MFSKVQRGVFSWDRGYEMGGGSCKMLPVWMGKEGSRFSGPRKEGPGEIRQLADQ